MERVNLPLGVMIGIFHDWKIRKYIWRGRGIMIETLKEIYLHYTPRDDTERTIESYGGRGQDE